MSLLEIKNLHVTVDGNEILKGIDLTVNADKATQAVKTAVQRITPDLPRGADAPRSPVPPPSGRSHGGTAAMRHHR